MLKYLFISLRIPHWIKNSFIFAALIFSKQLFEIPSLIKAGMAFLLFSMISSSGYLINDLADISEDRRHPLKSKRPIASGKLPRYIAIWCSIIMVGLALPCGFWLNRTFGTILVGYFILGLAYSLLLKHIVIIDVFFIALGFIFRVLAGGVAIQVEVSTWLLICTALIALFLGFSKRRHELVLLEDNASRHRRVLTEYNPYFLDQMISVVTAATLISYIFYTLSTDTIQKFGTDKLILTTPFVLYGIFRYLYLVHQKKEGGSPTKLLLTDLPLMINVALWVLCAVLIIY